MQRPDVEYLRERLDERTTKDVWFVDDFGDIIIHGYYLVSTNIYYNDARLICAAINQLQDLLDYIEHLEAKIDDL